MAYNNGFPVGYQNYFQQPIQQPIQQQNNASSIIWVQGLAGAKSYLVAPNTTVQLWDSEEQVIYLKSADATGMPTMKVLDYTIREQANAPTVQSELIETDFATKKELLDIKEQIEELKKQIEGSEKNESII
jgi:hypothetical protein